MTIANLSLSLITAQAGALRASLQLQPNAGTEAQRAQWMASLDRSVALAGTPVGPFASLVFGDSWNLNRAQGLLDRVRSKATAAGMLLAQPREGFAANLNRFDATDRAVARAKLYVLQPGSVREERSFDVAVRLVKNLFESSHPPFQTLALMLDRAFEAHVRRLDARVAMMPDLVAGDALPADAAYPRYFEHAHANLMDYLRDALVSLHDGQEIPWERCRRETIEELMERQARREGVDAKASTDKEVRHRDTALSMQIPEYSEFQLFCLIRQIREGEPDVALIEDLQRARNGCVLRLNDAVSAEIQWEDLLQASELIGNIDVIHTNIEVAYELARREQPHVDPEIVELQVRVAVARLGKKTGSSRPDYDAAIEELKRLEANPKAGRVIPFRRK